MRFGTRTAKTRSEDGRVADGRREHLGVLPCSLDVLETPRAGRIRLWGAQLFALLVALAMLAAPSVGWAEEIELGMENNPTEREKSGDLPLDLDAMVAELEAGPIQEESLEDDEELENEVPFFGEGIGAESDTLVFVIDQSGSMGGGSVSVTNPDTGVTTVGSKMARAKSELVTSIQALPETWKFSIVAYDCSVETFSPVLLEATIENKARATTWVSDLHACGGTNTAGAACQGLQIDRENTTIVLLSDGQPNCLSVSTGSGGGGGTGMPSTDPVQQHLETILACNSQGATINTFGIQAAGRFEQFLVQLANATGGSYTSVNM